ncbi:MAG: 3-oxoacyl-[acyl-carrier-protein] reductase [Fimbriimonadaceae bacterium]|nr:3-oxoacyl-[acyl-carrier-protein] reductase [Fimbriimonadaceae bacterium]
MNEARIAVVTGANRGIGSAIARELARTGMRVACIALHLDLAQEFAAELDGGSVGFECDVSDPAAVKECYAAVVESMGVPLVLVNNAGVTRDGLLIRMSDEDWEAVLNVNLKGAFHWCRACASGMMKARYGRIVNIGSVVGLSGSAGQANYAASKAGLIGMSKAIAKELGGRGVTCNVVAPGFIETLMTQELPEQARAAALAQTPLGRFGSPEDVAATVGFLVGEASGYVTGQVVAVDGGMAL